MTSPDSNISNQQGPGNVSPLYTKGLPPDTEQIEQQTPIEQLKIFQDQIAQTPSYLIPEKPQHAYVADTDLPHIPEPETETKIQQRPYKLAERQAIRQQLSKEFHDLLAQHVQEQGLSISDEQIADLIKKFEEDPENPNLPEEFKELAEQAFGKIKRVFKLPNSFTLKSNKESNWIPTTTYGGKEEKTPYSSERQKQILAAFKEILDSKIKGNLMDSSFSGEEITLIASLVKDPSLIKNLENDPSKKAFIDAANEIRGKAISETAKTFSLSPAWRPGTTDPVLWTPTGEVGPVDTILRNSNEISNLLTNSFQFGDEFTTKLEETLKSLPLALGSDPGAADLMKQILEALQEFKKYLYEHGSPQDAKRIEALTEDRITKIKENFKDIEKKLKQMEKAKKKQKVMKILQPIMITVGAIITVVSILLSPLTLGASLALAAVGAAMIIMGIVNTQTHFMDKAVKGLLEGMLKMMDKFPGMDKLSEAERKAITSAIVAAVMIAVVVAMVVGSSGSATNVALNITLQIAFQITSQVTLQMVGPVLSDMILNSFRATKSEDWVEKNEWIIRLTVQIFVALTAIVALGVQSNNMLKNISGGQSLAKIINEKFGNWVDNSSKVFIGVNVSTQAVQAGLAVGTGLVLLKSAQARKEAEELDAKIEERNVLIKLINDLIGRLIQSQQESLSTIQATSDAQERLFQTQSEATTQLFQG